MHGAQKRASGDPYFSHPVEVAGLMTDLKMDEDTIITALLHDTVEDTLTSIEDIESRFGPEVARLVDGVTKLSKIEAQTEDERAAENLRKFLLAISDDIRVLLVKLADRLHNMRTLHFIKSPEKRSRIAKETMDIYAPLAERIGMYEYMREMQLLAFEQLEPEAYQTITGRLKQIRDKADVEIDQINQTIAWEMEQAGLKIKISGREKHPYSIWKKMQERHVAFEQLTDINAFRVITTIVTVLWVCFIAGGKWCPGVSKISSLHPSATVINRFIPPSCSPKTCALRCRSEALRCTAPPSMALPRIGLTNKPTSPMGRQGGCAT
jgi:GTP pyrophosphokinase